MSKFKLEDGFEIEVNEAIVNDYRFMKCLVKAMKNEDDIESANSLIDIISLLLGKNEDAFIEHVATAHNGVADVQTMMTEVFKIIDSIKVTDSTTGEEVEAGKN